MKSVKYLIMSICLVMSVASCDFLEKEPTKLTPDIYFNNEKEAYSFLTSIYSALSSQSFYGCDYMHLVCGDDLSHYGGGRVSESKGVIACNNASSSSPAFSALWTTLYVGIDRANTFLENIDKVDMDEKLKEQYRAEARFLRSYYYFILVECWGDVPFKTNSTQSVVGLDIPRTDKEIIYDFIIEEMADCSSGLKSAADLGYKPGHVSRSAAWGILARVYLFRAGEFHRDNETEDRSKTLEYYRQASIYGQKVMGENHKLADNYWDVFIDLCSGKYNSTANESIWEVEFAGTYEADIRAEGRIGNMIGIKAPDLFNEKSLIGKQDPGFGYAYYWTTPKLYELYLANNDIERMNWNIAPFTYVQANGKEVTGREFRAGKIDEVKTQYWDQSYSYGDGDANAKIGDYELAANSPYMSNYSLACGKYRREYECQDKKKNKNYTSINFPILRYSDVLLMVAEAENEVNNGPTLLANECVHQVRNRAGIDDIDQNLDYQSFKQAVKDERAMELCFEYTRRFDLIRWGEYIKNMNELAPRAQRAENWSGGDKYGVYTFFQIPDSYNYFPIPDSEISVNKLMTQNPGW